MGNVTVAVQIIFNFNAVLFYLTTLKFHITAGKKLNLSNYSNVIKFHTDIIKL